MLIFLILLGNTNIWLLQLLLLRYVIIVIFCSFFKEIKLMEVQT